MNILATIANKPNGQRIGQNRFGKNFTRLLNHLLKPEYIFLILGGVFGLMFVIITPPFRAPDEQTHLYRAYSITEGHILAQKVGRDSVTQLPSSLKALVYEYYGGTDPFHGLEKKYLFRHNLETAMRIKLNPGERSFYKFSNTAMYSPLVYLPSSLGILIGRIMGLPVLIVLYLGRIFNLAAFIALIYVAIKLIPRYKYVFLAIGLLPTTLFLAASLSIDGIIIGSSFIFIAGCLRLYKHSNKLDIKDIMLILLPLLVLGTSKFAYLTLLILLIPIYFKLKARRQKLLLLATVGTALLVSFGWLVIAKKTQAPNWAPMPLNEGYQIKDTIKRPLHFLSAANNTLFTDERGLLQGVIGKLDWLRVDVPLFVVIINFILLAFAAIYREADNFYQRYQKIIFAAITVISLYLTLFVMLISWNSPNHGYIYIAGFQPRYFLPVLPLLLMLFNNKYIYIPENKRAFSIFSFVIITLSLILTTGTMMNAFYI